MPPDRTLVLASSSASRQTQLSRLGLSFKCSPPNIDETPLAHESAQELVLRLSEQKAAAVADKFPDALIIAGDQTAVLDGNYVNKPGSQAGAVEQLLLLQGRSVIFTSGLCVLDSRRSEFQSVAVNCEVQFRQLTVNEIETYVALDDPIHCAGSFKCESLGIALFEYVKSDDPSAITGMPLIALVSLLAKHGYKIFA